MARPSRSTHHYHLSIGRHPPARPTPPGELSCSPPGTTLARRACGGRTAPMLLMLPASVQVIASPLVRGLGKHTPPAGPLSSQSHRQVALPGRILYLGLQWRLQWRLQCPRFSGLGHSLAHLQPSMPCTFRKMAKLETGKLEPDRAMNNAPCSVYPFFLIRRTSCSRSTA